MSVSGAKSARDVSPVTGTAARADTATAKKPKVAFLVSHSSAGGAQEIWANLAEGFATRGYPTQLLALYPYREIKAATPDRLPWTYIVPQRPTTPGAQLAMLQVLVTYFRTTPPDVLFTAMPAANALAPVAARLAGAHTRIHTSHHSPVNTYSKALNVVDSWTGSIRNVQSVISVSRSVKESLAKRSPGYQEKLHVIYNALPPEIEAHLAARAQGREGRTVGRRVVATGRLAAQKNYPTLIRAAAHMPDVEIQIVGNGPDEAELKQLAQDIGVTDRVVFMGHRSRKEALEILAAGDVFAQPSLFEGHSLGLIEAAKLGVPLVVSDVAVQLEGITAADGERCGIAVGALDDVALAREICRLLDEPAHYRAMAAKSRQLAGAISFDDMIEQYEALAS